MDKIPVKSIKITRVEGRIIDTPETVYATTWANANTHLYRMAYHAPTLGYYKCDFTVTYEDGEEYKGRYDLMHISKEWPNLAKHVRDHIDHYTGRHCPSWLTAEQYATYLAQFGKEPGNLQWFSDHYQVGDVSDNQTKGE